MNQKPFNSQSRPADVTIEESAKGLTKRLSLVANKKIKLWKALLFAFFLAGFVAALTFVISLDRFSSSEAASYRSGPPSLLNASPVKYTQKGDEWNFNFPAASWSTFSLPIQESVPLSVFSQQCPKEVIILFYFDEKTQNYAQVQPSEQVIPGRGYYVFMMNYCSVKVQGNGRKFSTHLLQKDKWYFIGSAAKSVRVKDIKGKCQNLEVWEFKYNRYQRAETLQPTQAYWVKSKNDCAFGSGLCQSDSDCKSQLSYCPMVVGGDKAKCAPDTHQCYCGGVCGDGYCDEYEKRSKSCEKDCSKDLPPPSQSPISTAKITQLSLNSWQFDFPQNWSVFSIPLKEGLTIEQIKKKCSSFVAPVFAWNPETENYQEIWSGNLSPGRGYTMFLFNNSCSFTAQGNAYELGEIPLVAKRWDMIGAGAKEKLINKIKGDCIDLTVYYYDNPSQSYQPTDRLKPGYGYWIRSMNNCVFNPFKCLSDKDCQQKFCPMVVGGDKAKCASDTHQCYCGGVCGDKYCDEYEKRLGSCKKDCG